MFDPEAAREADEVVRCTDFDAALKSWTEDQGFRLDLIFPADAPRLAVLSGNGMRVRLESDATTPPTEDASFVLTRYEGETWGTGRAGMQYRDLIPGRLGGRCIASHIRIPEGGPVPDYVHHHHVRFQMIYCHRGWVKVVYEDQGEPFVMRPGDCVLQPPHIRHRVLECSDGMEVIRKQFSPEFRNRLDSIIQFASLDPVSIKRVVDKLVVELESKLDNNNVTLELNYFGE